MAVLKSCLNNFELPDVLRGNTFFGDVEVIGHGPDSLVRLTYDASKMETGLDRLMIEIVARMHVTELVFLKAGTID